MLMKKPIKDLKTFIMYCCFHLNRRKNELLFNPQPAEDNRISCKVCAIKMPEYGIFCDFKSKTYQYITPEGIVDCKTLDKVLMKLKATLDSNKDLPQYDEDEEEEIY